MTSLPSLRESSQELRALNRSRRRLSSAWTSPDLQIHVPAEPLSARPSARSSTRSSTDSSDPIQLEVIPLDSSGTLSLIPAPGYRLPGMRRSLISDLKRLKSDYNVSLVISLMTPTDYLRYYQTDLEELKAEYQKHHLSYINYPFNYRIGTPLADQLPRDSFRFLIGLINDHLDLEYNLVIHCTESRIRSSIVACAVLLSRGVSFNDAIRRVSGIEFFDDHLDFLRSLQ